MALYMLTRPDGQPIYINPDAIAYITSPSQPAATGANSEIMFDSGTRIYVKETPGAVVDHVRHD